MNSQYFKNRLEKLITEYGEFVTRPNSVIKSGNGLYERYQNPVLTRDSIPLIWRYDFNQETNPYLIERLGINAVFNAGAVEYNGKICLVARIEGVDRKSFFAVAESENGVDNFRFRSRPIVIEPIEEGETNYYDMRLTKHEDGWVYGLFCVEKHDDAYPDNPAAARASCGIVRTKDLENWERLPNLKSVYQQRNVVLHPEFVNGKYGLYTRPSEGFMDTGACNGIGWALVDSMENAVITEEKIIERRIYHTVKEVKNGEGPTPIKTDIGWLHIPHGVRAHACGLRYVLYVYITDLKDPSKVIYTPGGHFLSALGPERSGDVPGVVFCNGAVKRSNGDVFIYYASSDTRTHVIKTSVDRLVDYVINTPPDELCSYKSVEQRISLIEKNEDYLSQTTDSLLKKLI